MSEFSISEIEIARRTTAALEGGRRVRRYRFTPEAIVLMFTHGQKFLVTNGVPAGCAFRGFTIDPTTNTIAIWLEHESFIPIPAGGIAMDGPMLEFTRIED